MEGERPSGDMWWILGRVVVILAAAAGVLTVLLGPLHLDAGGAGRLPAVLAFVGVVVSAIVSVIGLALTRQANRRLSAEGREASNRLRTEAFIDWSLSESSACFARDSLASRNSSKVFANSPA